jgi:hypothetical protein
MKVKIFAVQLRTGVMFEDAREPSRKQPQGIEDEINNWIAANPGVKVKSIQTAGWPTATASSASTMVVTVAYEETAD